MKKLLYLALLVCLLVPATKAAAYDPDTVPVPDLLLEKYQGFFPPEVIQVTDGVYVASGYNRDNPVLIEGTNGLIIVDPGESIPAAQAVEGRLQCRAE